MRLSTNTKKTWPAESLHSGSPIRIALIKLLFLMWKRLKMCPGWFCYIGKSRKSLFFPEIETSFVEGAVLGGCGKWWVTRGRL